MEYFTSNISKVGAIIRAVLMAGGAALGTLGYVNSNDVTDAVLATESITGALTFLVGLGWSIVLKVRGTPEVPQEPEAPQS